MTRIKREKVLSAECEEKDGAARRTLRQKIQNAKDKLQKAKWKKMEGRVHPGQRIQNLKCKKRVYT
jgi:hypothetical protein